MTRSTPRLAAIAAAAIALAFAALLAGQSTATAPAASGAKTDCGTYDSASTFDRGQVFAIRGVNCRKARKVAKKYDHKGTAPVRGSARSLTAAARRCSRAATASRAATSATGRTR